MNAKVDDEHMAPAYVALMTALLNSDSGGDPIAVQDRPAVLELELGPSKIRKYDDGDLLICHMETDARSLWWYQVGDNTSELLCMYGADPAEASKFADLKKADVAPLELVQIYKTDNPAHWLYLTFGLSNLYDINGDPEGDSGFGMELTMRIAATAEQTEPPLWPVRMLRDLARHCFEAKKSLRYGNYIDFGKSIFPKTQTQMEGLAVSFDSVLEPCRTLSGYLDILSVVGLTRDELDMSADMNTSLPFVSAFQKEYAVDGVALFDYQRNSMLAEMPGEVIASLLAHADYLERKQRTQKLQRMLLGALDLLRTAGGPQTAFALQHLLDCAKTNGDLELGLKSGKELVALLQENSQVDIAVDTLEELAKFCVDLNRKDLAIEFIEQSDDLQSRIQP